jgi:hypothetical protein
MANHFIEIDHIPKVIFQNLLEDCFEGFFGGHFPMPNNSNYNEKRNNLIIQAERKFKDNNSFAFINVEDNSHVRQLWIGKQIENTFISEIVLFGRDKNNSKAYLYNETDWIVNFGNYLKENNVSHHRSKFVKGSDFEKWIKFQLNADNYNYEDHILNESAGPDGQIFINYEKELRTPDGKSL